MVSYRLWIANRGPFLTDLIRQGDACTTLLAVRIAAEATKADCLLLMSTMVKL